MSANRHFETFVVSQRFHEAGEWMVHRPSQNRKAIFMSESRECALVVAGSLNALMARVPVKEEDIENWMRQQTMPWLSEQKDTAEPGQSFEPNAGCVHRQENPEQILTCCGKTMMERKRAVYVFDCLYCGSVATIMWS